MTDDALSHLSPETSLFERLIGPRKSWVKSSAIAQYSELRHIEKYWSRFAHHREIVMRHAHVALGMSGNDKSSALQLMINTLAKDHPELTESLQRLSAYFIMEIITGNRRGGDPYGPPKGYNSHNR